MLNAHMGAEERCPLLTGSIIGCHHFYADVMNLKSGYLRLTNEYTTTSF